MPAEEFWNLTWYDFGLWCLRIHENNKKRNEDRELSVLLTREFMSLFANANRDHKKRPQAYTGHDFFLLSSDTKIDVAVDPDLMDRMKKRFGSKLKKRG